MSTTFNAELIATYESFIQTTRVTHAIAALVCYEYLLTFKYEIDFLWKRKWSAATWIFVFNRYLLLANVISQAMPIAPQICNNSRFMDALFFFVIGAFITVPNHLFSVLRTFALLQNYSWRRPVTSILTALYLLQVVLASYTEFTQVWTYFDDPIFGSSCFVENYSVPFAVVRRVANAESAISIFLASIVLGIALLKTATQVRQASVLGLKTTLSEVLLRDGSLFFLLILLQDLYTTMASLDKSFLNSPFANAATPVLFVLPQLLLSRFIINLRQIDSTGSDTSASQHSSRFSVANFRMPTMNDVVGNLGEPLEFADYCLDDEDDAQDNSANLNINTDADMDPQDVDLPSMCRLTGVVDVEANSQSCSGSDSIDPAVLDIDGIELKEISPVSPV